MAHKVGNLSLNLTWTEPRNVHQAYTNMHTLHVGKYLFASVSWKSGTQGKDDGGFCVYPRVPGLKREIGPHEDLDAAKAVAVRCVEVWFTNATDPTQSPPQQEGG